MNSYQHITDISLGSAEILGSEERMKLQEVEVCYFGKCTGTSFILLHGLGGASVGLV